MSSARTIWPFIDEILGERGPWRFYGVHFDREIVLACGIKVDVTVFLNDTGTGRRLSVSLLGEDPPTLRDLSRCGYALDRIGRHTFGYRPLTNDRELVAEVRRWDEIARSGSLRQLPTRKQRTLAKQSTAFPANALALLRDLAEWPTAFAGAAIRSAPSRAWLETCSLLHWISFPRRGTTHAGATTMAIHGDPRIRSAPRRLGKWRRARASGRRPRVRRQSHSARRPDRACVRKMRRARRRLPVLRRFGPSLQRNVDLSPYGRQFSAIRRLRG